MKHHAPRQPREGSTTRDHKTFTITVDDEPVVVPRKGNTARSILEAAGLDATQRYLMETRGNQTVSYKDNPDIEVQVRENKAFFTGRCGPVPVS